MKTRNDNKKASSTPESNEPLPLSEDIYLVITMEYKYNREVEAIPVGAYTSWDEAIINARTAFDNSENGEHQDTGYYSCYDRTNLLDPAIGGTAFGVDTCTDIYSEVDIKTITLNKKVKRTAYFDPVELEVIKKGKHDK